jgi:hypothetical protein
MVTASCSCEVAAFVAEPGLGSMLSGRDSRIAGNTEHSEGQQAYSVIRKQLIILGTMFSGVDSSVSL